MVVLKLDNGSPFVAGVTRALLAQWRGDSVSIRRQVVRSTMGCAIEAGIGASLKVRHPLPGGASGAAGRVDAGSGCRRRARQQANTLGRPWGAHGPAPAEQLGEVGIIVTNQERQALRGFERRVPARRGGRVTPRAPAGSVEPAAARQAWHPSPCHRPAVAAASVVDHPTAGGVAASSGGQ